MNWPLFRIDFAWKLLLLLPLFHSCSETEIWNPDEATTAIFAPDEAQFRRFEVGMSRIQFDAAYTGNAIYGNELEVIDSLTVAKGVYCETAFRFDANSILKEISVQLVIDTEQKKNELFKSIESKLSKDFGKGVKDRDQYYWRAESSLLTTDIYLTDYSSGTTVGKEAKYVIVLYYTAGTSVS